MYDSDILLNLDYNFEYIRYETDYGYFFQNFKEQTVIGLQIYFMLEFIKIII